jgi:hypothetical protein
MMRIVDLEFSLRTIEKKVWLTLILLGFVSDNWIRYFHLEVLPSLETHYMKKKQSHRTFNIHFGLTYNRVQCELFLFYFPQNNNLGSITHSNHYYLS